MRPDDQAATAQQREVKAHRAARARLAVAFVAIAALGIAGLREHRTHSAAHDALVHRTHTSKLACCATSHHDELRGGKIVFAPPRHDERRSSKTVFAPSPLHSAIRPRQHRTDAFDVPRFQMLAVPSRRIPARAPRRVPRVQVAAFETPQHLRPVSSKDGQRAYLSLSVNGLDEGEILALIRKADVLVPIADLQRAGIQGIAAASQVIGGQEYVSLASLAPGIAYTFNEPSLLLKLTAKTEYFAGSVIDLHGNRPPGIQYSRSTSAFFNYALDWQNFQQFSEFSELGVSSHGNLYYSGLSIQSGGRFVRGLTNATFDNPALMKRWVVGDSFADGGELGGSTFLGGISVSRNFSLNPYFTRYPGVGISGATLTPSTAQIYVNGYLVSTQQLPPGNFNIANIPVVAGGGNTTVVVRDAFGRTQTLSSPYYYATTVLQRGLTEYSYNLGSRRQNVETSSADYGPIAFVGRDRVGITDWFTAGARLEAGAGLISGGPTMNFRLGSGQLGVNAALSHAGGLAGGALEADYSYQNRWLSYGGSLATVGTHYATTSLPPTADRATNRGEVFAGFALGPRASLTLDYSTSRLRDTGIQQQLLLAGGVRLSDKFDLVATADHMHTSLNPSANQYFVALNYQIGRNALAAVSEQGGINGSGSGVSVQQSLPLGTGVGYRFAHGTGSQIHDDDLIQYQGAFGSYQVSYRQLTGLSQTDFLASGGLVDAGDGIMFTRAVEDGFAVIDLPNLSGVRGYFNNQEVGRTDKKGRLLIPNLLSYYGNRLGISDQDVPLNYSIQSTQETVAPPYRGGALVHFQVQKLSAITGNMVVDDAHKASVPSFGELRVTVNGHALVSELGRRGEFYLENLSPGRYPAEVEYADGLCAFQLIVPRQETSVTEMGRVRCSAKQISGVTP